MKKICYLLAFFFCFTIFEPLNAQNTNTTAYNYSSTCSVQVWCLEYCSGIGSYVNNIGLIPPGGQITWLTPFCSATVKLVPEGHSHLSGTVYDQISCSGSWNESSSGTCSSYTLSASPTCSVPCTGQNITSQPQNQLFCTGNSPTFCVGASGTGLSYQWEYSWDGVNAEGNASETGNTTACLSNFPATAVDAYFRARITDGAGCVEHSDWARLIGGTTPNVSAGSDETICTGNSVSLNATGADYYSWSTGESTGNISVAPTANTTYTVTGYSASGADENIVTNITGFNSSNFSFINAINYHGTPASLFDYIDNTDAGSFHAERQLNGQTWGISYDLGSSFLISTVGLDQRNDCCTSRARGGVVQVYNNGALVYTSSIVTGVGDGVLSTSPNLVGDRVDYVFPNGIDTEYNSGTLNFSEWFITGQAVCSATDNVSVTISTDPVCLCENQGGDSDNDGTCDNQDCQPNNPAYPTTPGATCDDGNANTTNDVVTADGCGCIGTPVPCAGQGGDSDGDGTCDNQDCQPNNPAYPTTPGATCDDGNANTTNDVVTADGCGCEGTPVATGCMVTTDACSITITGLTSSEYAKVFDVSWNIVWQCHPWANGGCSDTETITDLENGTYYVQACGGTETVSISGCTGGGPCDGQGGDSDGDGTCDNQDCQPNNAAYPATPGTICNDGNTNTTNDVVTADGCGCAGTPEPTDCNITTDNCTITITGLNSSDFGKVFDASWSIVWECHPWANGGCSNTETITGLENGTYYVQACGDTETITLSGCSGGGPCDGQGGDSDGDGTCDSQDCQPNNAAYPATPGIACNDGNANTTNDVVTADGCGCEGTPIPCAGQGGDSDGDGTCDNQDCQPNNAAYPATPGATCDDGNANTTNDVVTADGCGCEGTPVSTGCSVTSDNCTITITGLNSSEYAKVFNTSWSIVWECHPWANGGCNNTETITGLENGTYYVQACGDTEAITLSGCSGGGPCDGQGGDSDGDGTCDNQDCQPNNAAYPATPGATCDDGDANTTNDVVTADGCGCAGTAEPTDCSVTTDNCTITITGLNSSDFGKVFDASWNIVWECHPWANGGCNNTETITGLGNGTYYVQACGGTETITLSGCSGGGPCDGQGGDADGDGTCDNQDCQPNNAAYPATPGADCDDGNANTTNDVVTADGCGCEGTAEPTDCNITTDNCSITITGLTSSEYAKVFDASWNIVWQCHPWANGGCSDTETIEDLDNGTYYVQACGRTETVTLSGCTGGGPCDDQGGDSDGDGTCDNQDCQPNNAAYPATPGTACDDGNANTANDVVTADGCGCTGTPVTICKTYKITDSDPACGVFPGTGVFFRRDCNPTFNFEVWKAGSDLILKELDNNSALISGTIYNGSTIGTVNINLNGFSQSGQYWEDLCYTNPLTPEYFYTSFSGTITVNGTAYTIVQNTSGIDVVLGSGASNDVNGGLGFGGWTTGTWGSCNEMFGNLTLLSTQGCEGLLLEEQNNESLYFNAQKDGRDVTLSWTTNTDYKNDYFEVEHATDGINFSLISEVNSISDSESHMNYQDRDAAAKVGMNYYRIKQIFNDGSYAYSAVKEVAFDLDVNKFEIYPNPTADDVFVNLKDFAGNAGNIQIVNSLGQIVYTQQLDIISAEPLRISTQDMKSGVHAVSVQIEDKKVMTELLMVVKR